MSDESPYGPILERNIWGIYKEYFHLAERRRRWSIEDDIPWDQVNPATSPAVATVVESFCAVELFLPDYVGKFLPMVRGMRGRAWFAANWGYEESKHSWVLHEWLVRSGHRTEEQIEEVQKWAVVGEFLLPFDNARAMACYTMAQELATFLHYRNLRLTIGETDPALSKILSVVAIDERAHYDFYVKVLRLHLADDRAGTIEALKRVLTNFAMPVTHLLADSQRRVNQVRDMGIFNESIFFTDVYRPILASLGVEHSEMRSPRAAQKKSQREPAAELPPN